MKSSLYIFVSFFICLTASAQIDTVKIQVTGLTCSSCSKSVEEKIRLIDFVSAVKMNLNLNEATILVNFSKQVDWDVLAKAVYDAGFSVGAFYVPDCERVTYNINGKQCAYSYIYIGDPHTFRSNGYVRLAGKYFMDKKTYHTWVKKIPYPLPPIPETGNKHYYYF